MSDRSSDFRAVAHRAVTEGVNLKYVDTLRHAVYEAANELDAALARVRVLEDALKHLTSHRAPAWIQEIAREALWGRE